MWIVAVFKFIATDRLGSNDFLKSLMHLHLVDSYNEYCLINLELHYTLLVHDMSKEVFKMSIECRVSAISCNSLTVKL